MTLPIQKSEPCDPLMAQHPDSSMDRKLSLASFPSVFAITLSDK